MLGRGLLLWRSPVFLKPPGGAATPWHSDGEYFTRRLEPVINVTAWIALDNVDRRNACLRVIPGSHRQAVPHVAAAQPVDRVFYHHADPAVIDEAQAVHLEMAAGECVLFNELLLHGSTPNTTEQSRMGLSGRFTVPKAKINGHHLGAVLVRGRDDLRLNALAAPPDPVMRTNREQPAASGRPEISIGVGAADRQRSES